MTATDESRDESVERMPLAKQVEAEFDRMNVALRAERGRADAAKVWADAADAAAKRLRKALVRLVAAHEEACPKPDECGSLGKARAALAGKEEAE